MSNEELSSSNQELRLYQEELRSVSERLTTTNVELASKNELLVTLNAAISRNIEELEQLYGDVESVALPTVFLDRGLSIRRFTPASREALRLDDKDIGRSLRETESSASSTELYQRVQQVLDDLQPRELELSVGDRQFLARMRPHRTTKNVIIGVVVTFVDVSAVKRAEAASALSRLYAVLGRVNEALFRTREPQALYEKVCRIVADGGRFPLVWIGLVRERKVLPAAWSGPAFEYLRRISEGADGELDSGPVCTSVQEDRTVINDDVRGNSAAAPWQQLAASFGFRASVALPLHRQGKVVGVLSLYATNPGAFDSVHVGLLEALAGDISYALDAIEQERLRAEAEQALREAEHRKNRFLAMLSHELRNPLAPIANSLAILERSAPGTEQAERARNVVGRQVQQLTRLVDDLLDVTRIATGKLRLVRRRFELVELVRRTAEDHRPLLEAAGIAFELSSGDRPLWVDGDEARIAQVIGNLLSNAAKFTRAGGRVALELEPDPSYGMAVLRVRDTGIGMSSEVLDRLFEPFVQADDTLDRSRGGLGLGLALVKGVVQQHGGQVEAHSPGLGGGAEFVVRLPAAARRAAKVRPKSSKPPTPRKVLVIEDNADAAETLRDVLELEAHQVEVAGSGPEGIAKAQSLRPEVVFCDIGLPGMDGYEVARALRRDNSLDSTQLVALTGYAQPEDEARAREAGFDVHLPKPLSLERIEAVLAGLPER